MVYIRNKGIVDRRYLSKADSHLASALRLAGTEHQTIEICRGYTHRQIGLACELCVFDDVRHAAWALGVTRDHGSRDSLRRIARVIDHQKQFFSQELVRYAQSIAPEKRTSHRKKLR